MECASHACALKARSHAAGRKRAKHGFASESGSVAPALQSSACGLQERKLDCGSLPKSIPHPVNFA